MSMKNGALTFHVLHRNAQRDPQMQLDAKMQVRCNVSRHVFIKSVPVPPKHENIVCHCFAPMMTQNALRDTQIQPNAKTQIGVICHNAISKESILGPPELK
jgi:hypothetical protein